MIVLFALSVLAIVLTVAGFLWLLDRRDQREREERARLVQRLQAPHLAVVEHHAEITDQPAVVTSEGDGMPLSDAEMAERQEMADASAARERLLQFIEDAENGRAQIVDGVLT